MWGRWCSFHTTISPFIPPKKKRVPKNFNLSFLFFNENSEKKKNGNICVLKKKPAAFFWGGRRRRGKRKIKEKRMNAFPPLFFPPQKEAASTSPHSKIRFSRFFFFVVVVATTREYRDRGQPRSPMTNQPLYHSYIATNFNLRARIRDFIRIYPQLCQDEM